MTWFTGVRRSVAKKEILDAQEGAGDGRQIQREQNGNDGDHAQQLHQADCSAKRFVPVHQWFDKVGRWISRIRSRECIIGNAIACVWKRAGILHGARFAHRESPAINGWGLIQESCNAQLKLLFHSFLFAGYPLICSLCL